MSASNVIKKRREEQAEKKRKAASTGGGASKKQRTKKEIMIRRSAIAGGVVLFLLLIVAACAPKKGSMKYGICLVYTELMIDFSHTLQINYVEEYSNRARIGFSHIDNFGQYSNDMIDCHYGNSPDGNTILTKIEFNREEIDEEKVKLFNNAIPAIIEYNPDLTLPRPIPDTLSALKK